MPVGGGVHVARLAIACVLVASSCSSERSPGSETASTMDPLSDKLAQILARGTLVLSSDPAYPPESFAVKGATRPADTRCTSAQMTGPEMTGMGAETGKLVAERLGVEPCFVTPSWTEVTSGNWSDRWDLDFEGGSINTERMEVLYFTQPYYATAAYFYVARGSKIDDPGDLAGSSIGACASCSHELYLRGRLEIPGQVIEPVVRNPHIVTYDVEAPGLRALARGEIDAFLAQEQVGTDAIEAGLAIEPIGEPVFYLYASGIVDKSSGLSVASFIERVNEILREAHHDGTLSALSVEFFGDDYAEAASAFDVDAVPQDIE